MALVERGWFTMVLGGERGPFQYSSGDNVIEKCARHTGHADLVRERIDGTLGV